MQWQEFRTHVRHLHTRDIGRIECAFELGKQVHANQKRKSGEPYFSHPVAVAHMLADLGADSDTLIAALLHDAVEDTPLTLAEIHADFGGSVSTLIDGVTKLSAKDIAISPRLDEQTETLRKIFTLMEQDVRIMVIKLVDRLHNMQTAAFLSPERQKSLAQETLDIYVKIADKICMQDLRDELEALCLGILEPETYRKLDTMRQENEQRGQEIVEHMKSKLRTYDSHLASRVSLDYEYKAWEQLRAQMQAAGVATTGLSALTVAFTTEDVDSCYRTLGVLHQLWRREVLSFQDYINAPQINGYQGIHTTVIVETGLRIRCKIRTRSMQEYARKGITLKCFDAKALGVFDYLPWTKRISPLASDTQGNSTEFWQSLQSDILGDSIVIHGPDDAAVQVPRNATALDAAFYLFQDDALRTMTIRMNGVEVPFNKPLTNAASVTIAQAPHETWNREWLRNVQTGFAAAKIRTHLNQQSTDQKLVTGQAMLQEILSERKRGFIEEFDEERLVSRAKRMGYASLNDVYVSISDGRLDPTNAYRSLFEKAQTDDQSSLTTSTLKYTADMDSVELMDQLNLIHRSYGSSLEDIHYHRLDKGITRVGLRVRMDARTLHNFQQALLTAGVHNFQVRRHPRMRDIWSIVLLVLLWGLDPIIARMILSQGVSAPELTFIRAWVVFGFASCVFLIASRGRSLVRIPFRHPSLWMAGIALFLMNMLTYAFLSEGSPSLYNTILRVNAIIIIVPLLRVRRWMPSVLGTISLGIAGITLAAMGPFRLQEWLLMAGIVAVFNVYTRLTSHFQTVARIQARYIQLFAMITMISALTSLLLLPTGQIQIPMTVAEALLPALYAVVFVGIPYMIFHAITDNFGYITVSPWLNALVLVTLIAQPLIIGDTRGFMTLVPAALLLSGASLLAARLLRKSE